MKEFYFLSGLPRSGSTLLATLLRQNGNVYVTSTSPMLDQLVANQDIYKFELQATKANYNQVQLDNITLRMIDNFWAHVPQQKIIDNNRGWARNLKATEILFKKRIKCIAVYRDIPSIMASWLSLIKKNENNQVDKDLFNRGLQNTDYNRMMLMWHEMVKDCVDSLLQALTDCPEDVLLINYDDLIQNPQNELNRINNLIGVNTVYSFENIDNHSVYQEDEKAWGLADMHLIRPKLEKKSKDSQEVLGQELFQIFSDINKDFFNKLKEYKNGK